MTARTPGFGAEFKAEAVWLMQVRQTTGCSLAQLVCGLDVGPDRLRLWARDAVVAYMAEVPPTGETLVQENRRFRREVATLQHEAASGRRRWRTSRKRRDEKRRDHSPCE